MLLLLLLLLGEREKNELDYDERRGTYVDCFSKDDAAAFYIYHKRGIV